MGRESSGFRSGAAFLGLFAMSLLTWIYDHGRALIGWSILTGALVAFIVGLFRSDLFVRIGRGIESSVAAWNDMLTWVPAKCNEVNYAISSSLGGSDGDEWAQLVFWLAGMDSLLAIVELIATDFATLFALMLVLVASCIVVIQLQWTYKKAAWLASFLMRVKTSNFSG